MSKDRTQIAREQFAAAQQRRAFQQQMASGAAQVLDRFGKPITPGALVLWEAPFAIVCAVQQIAPVLDPRFPPGLVQVVLTMTAPVQAVANQPQISLVVVGRQDEPGHATLTTPQAEGEAAAPEGEDAALDPALQHLDDDGAPPEGAPV